MAFKKQDLDALNELQFVGPVLHGATENQSGGDTGTPRRLSISYPADARPVLWGQDVFALRLGPVLISERTSQISRTLRCSVDDGDANMDLALVDGAGLTDANPNTTVSSGSTSATLTLDTTSHRGWYELVLLVRTSKTATLKTADIGGGSGVITSQTTIDMSSLGITLSGDERYLISWGEHSSSPADYIPGNIPGERHVQFWRDSSTPTPIAFASSPTVLHFWPPLDPDDMTFEGVNHSITFTQMSTVTLYGISYTETLDDYVTDPRDSMRPGMQTSATPVQELQARALRHHLHQTTIEHVGVYMDRTDTDEFGNYPSHASRIVPYNTSDQTIAQIYLYDRDRDQTITTQQTGASAGTDTTSTRTSYLVAATCLLVTGAGDVGTWLLDLAFTANEFSGSPGFDWTDDEVTGAAQGLGGEGFAAGLLRNRRLDTRRDLTAMALHLSPSGTGGLGGVDPAYQHLDGLIPASSLTRTDDIAGLRLFVFTVDDDPDDDTLFRRLVIEATGQERSIEGIGTGGSGRAWLHVGPVSVYVATQL